MRRERRKVFTWTVSWIGLDSVNLSKTFATTYVNRGTIAFFASYPFFNRFIQGKNWDDWPSIENERALSSGGKAHSWRCWNSGSIPDNARFCLSLSRPCDPCFCWWTHLKWWVEVWVLSSNYNCRCKGQ
jgi:hypothetical protein